MILSGLVLFLFGTAVSAGPYMAPPPTEIIISKNKLSSDDKVTEYYPSSKGSPFISNFIQKGTNVFFKPQFMLAAHQMPPQVQEIITKIEKDDCKTAYPMGPVPVLPIIEEPLRVIEREFFSPDIKEVIEINPMAIPAAPVLPPYVPVEVAPPMGPVVVEVNESRPPVVIPPAPVLPPLEMPRLPMIVERVPHVAPELPKRPVIIEEPCSPPEIIHEVELTPMVLPQAPVLPPFVPEPYVREVVVEEPVIIPSAPVLPPYSPPAFPTIVVEEKPAPVVVEEVVKPAVIPPAPVLPPLEMPKLPVLVEETKLVPCPPGEELHEIKPLVLPPSPVLPPMIFPEAPIFPPINIPQAPELPPFTMPSFPVEVIVEKNKVELVPSAPAVEIIEEHFQPMVIPEAPLLPPMGPLEIPAPVVIEESLVVPPAPMLPHLEVAVPCETPEIIKAAPIMKPVVLPPAPVLPPLEISRPPMVVERTAEVVVAPCPPEHEVIVDKRPVMPMPLPFAYSELSLQKPVILPPASVFPEFFIHKEGSVMVEKNPLLPFPTACAQDIVVERILPKMEHALRPHVGHSPVSVQYAPISYAV